MKRGIIISEIRKLARTGTMFSQCSFRMGKEFVQPVIAWLYRNGELKLVWKGRRGRYGRPAIYKATRKLAKVNCKKPLIP